MKIKMLFVVCSAVGVIGLCSCGKTVSGPVSLNGNLKVHGDIVQDDLECSVELERSGNAGWKAVFDEPKTVEGMEVEIFNDTYTVNFKGLSYTGDRENMPEYSPIALITSALDDCINDKVKCEKDGDIVIERGTVGELEFSARVEDGELSGLDIGDIITLKTK